MCFHSDAGPIGFLGARYPMASLLSSLDVDSYHCAGPSQKFVGVFHRDLSRRVEDLREYFCDHLSFQWTATTFSMGSHRPFGAAGFTYRGACMVFKSVSRRWMSLGVFSGPSKISPRYKTVCGCLRHHNRILRFRHGSFPASLSRALASNVAPTVALIGEQSWSTKQG